MRFNALISVISLVTISLAMPSPLPPVVPDAEADLDARDVGIYGNNFAGVYQCNWADWKGGCWWQVTSGGACHSWNPTAKGSFGPDQGVACTFYLDNACGAHNPKKVTGIVNPGISNVADSPFLNSQGLARPNSFNCHWLTV